METDEGQDRRRHHGRTLAFADDCHGRGIRRVKDTCAVLALVGRNPPGWGLAFDAYVTSQVLCMYSYFCGEQSTPAHMPPRDESDGDESSQGDNVVCKKQAQELVDSTKQAVDAGSSAAGERVGAVGLIQKVKSGVFPPTVGA